MSNLVAQAASALSASFILTSPLGAACAISAVALSALACYRAKSSSQLSIHDHRIQSLAATALVFVNPLLAVAVQVLIQGLISKEGSASELTRRLSSEEKEALDGHLAKTTLKGAEAIKDFLNSREAFLGLETRGDVFSDPMSIYNAIRALNEGMISLTQFSTFSIHHHLHGSDLVAACVVPLFDAEGNVNPEAKALLLSSISDEVVKKFEQKQPGPPQLQEAMTAKKEQMQAEMGLRPLNPSKEQVEAILERAKSLPVSEQVVMTFRDCQEPAQIAVFDLVVIELPKTISQATAATGLTFGNRGLGRRGEVVRIKLSMGLMEAALDEVRAEGASTTIRPVFGLSTRRDIEMGQRAYKRDMALPPLPDTELPDTADGFEAPIRDGDFTDHDFYHAMALARVPDSQVNIFLDVYRALPGFDEAADSAEGDFADQFLDLEMVGARASKLSPSDQVWAGVHTRVVILTSEALSVEGRKAAGLPERFTFLEPGLLNKRLHQVGARVAEVAADYVTGVGYLEKIIRDLENGCQELDSAMKRGLEAARAHAGWQADVPGFDRQVLLILEVQLAPQRKILSDQILQMRSLIKGFKGQPL